MVKLRGPIHPKLYTLINAKMQTRNETHIKYNGIVESKLDRGYHQDKLKTSRLQSEILSHDPNHP